MTMIPARFALPLTALFAITACGNTSAEQGATTDLDKEAIEQIVHDYIMDNPEIILEALIEDERRKTMAEIMVFEDEIFNGSGDVVIGPDNAKVTIVEFFDYNCGPCRYASDWVADVLEAHPKDVRVIFKELPIRESQTGTSRNAARMALAAGRQGKYEEMHFALMNASSVDQDSIDSIAEDLGLDVNQLKTDALDAEINNQINENLRLSRTISSIRGTPFFIIGDSFVPSADIQALEDTLKKELGS